MEQQLDPSNCLGIKTFAETHGCEELRKAAEKYILKHFVDLVDSEEFLQLDNEDVVSLIKCDNLTASERTLYLHVTVVLEKLCIQQCAQSHFIYTAHQEMNRCTVCMFWFKCIFCTKLFKPVLNFYFEFLY